MKFLLDANVPPSLAEEFSEFEVILSNSLPMGNASKDSEIIKFALENELILITKDIDFYYSFIQSRKPQKLILVKLGNMKIKVLRNYFKSNKKKILHLLDGNSMLILTQEQIQTFE